MAGSMWLAGPFEKGIWNAKGTREYDSDMKKYALVVEIYFQITRCPK